MKRMSRTVAAACVVVLGLTVAGCGGGSDDDKGDKKDATTVSSFKKEANAICKETLTKLQKAALKVDPKKPTQAQLGAVVDQMVDYLGTQVEALKKLEPPKDGFGDLDAYLDSLEKLAATAQKKGAAFVDPKVAPFTESNTRATALGLTDCVL